MPEKEKKEAKAKKSEEKGIEPLRPRFVRPSAEDLFEDFRRDFMRMWRPWRIRPLEAVREASVDLIDKGKEFEIRAEVPGIPKDKIEVSITKDYGEISAKAEEERKEEEKGYILRERGYQQLYRMISFPEEVDPDKAEAAYKDGLLLIRVPKKVPTPEIKKRRLEVK